MDVMYPVLRFQAPSQPLRLPSTSGPNPLAFLSFWNSWARVARISVRSFCEGGGEEQIKSRMSGELVR